MLNRPASLASGIYIQKYLFYLHKYKDLVKTYRQTKGKSSRAEQTEKNEDKYQQFSWVNLITVVFVNELNELLWHKLIKSNIYRICHELIVETKFY